MRRWIVSSLAVIVLAMSSAAACQPQPQPTKDDPFPVPAITVTSGATVPVTGDCSVDRLPPDPPNLDKKRYVVVYGCVEDGFQPLELLTSARDNTTGEYGEHSEPSAYTEVRYIIGYDTGHHVTLHIELKPSRAGSKKGFLYISDGEKNRKLLKIDGAWRALADFTVNR